MPQPHGARRHGAKLSVFINNIVRGNINIITQNFMRSC